MTLVAHNHLRHPIRLPLPTDAHNPSHPSTTDSHPNYDLISAHIMSCHFVPKIYMLINVATILIFKYIARLLTGLIPKDLHRDKGYLDLKGYLLLKGYHRNEHYIQAKGYVINKDFVLLETYLKRIV